MPDTAANPTPADRREAWADAVFAAIAALRRVMTDPAAEPVVVVKAARLILGLEMTRMRHGRPVIGTEGAKEAAGESIGPRRHAPSPPAKPGGEDRGEGRATPIAPMRSFFPQPPSPLPSPPAKPGGEGTRPGTRPGIRRPHCPHQPLASPAEGC